MFLIKGQSPTPPRGKFCLLFIFFVCDSSVAVPQISIDNPSLPILVSSAFSPATLNKELHMHWLQHNLRANEMVAER